MDSLFARLASTNLTSLSSKVTRTDEPSRSLQMIPQDKPPTRYLWIKWSGLQYPDERCQRSYPMDLCCLQSSAGVLHRATSCLKHEGLPGLWWIWRAAEGKLQLVTPLNKHTIEPGVTRQSVLDLARERLSAISPHWMGAELVEALKRRVGTDHRID
ncbi:hypothetical protein BDV27DRAFT_108813 [Aspergillus caelatus]|uniref:Uncharacterized protein n=1 Tax=Aspergillus caelatus TaxID=61420 RepID=A0A5N7A6Z0_9EURO|nr:uncharacterized protein BDV27DRAFT_108813 [Aspergillus caelatus]KAE8364976.1 hypothetical protein BDV27DRAFT_108813 [Aspergillus caelatus]